MNSEEMKPTGDPNLSGQSSGQSSGQPELEKSIHIENSNENSNAGRPLANLESNKGLNDSLNFDRMMGEAREQMSKAADAFSRGDFLQEEVIDPAAANDDRLVAALCYFVPGLMSLLVLFSDSGNKRPFQRYHAIQSLGLSAALIAITLAYTVISAIAWAVPIIGWVVGVALFCLSPIAFLMAVSAYIYYGYQAYLGKRFSIPGLTSYLRDQKWI